MKFFQEYPKYQAAEKLDRVWEEYNLDKYLFRKIASFLNASAIGFKKLKPIEGKNFRAQILSMYHKSRVNDLKFFYGSKLPEPAITHIENILYGLCRKNIPGSATYKD